jgi:hypothetical protein
MRYRIFHMLKQIISGVTALSLSTASLPAGASTQTNMVTVDLETMPLSRISKRSGHNIAVMCHRDSGGNLDYANACADVFVTSFGNIYQGFGQNVDDAFRPQSDYITYARGTTRDTCHKLLSPHLSSNSAVEQQCDTIVVASVNVWQNWLHVKHDEIIAYKESVERQERAARSSRGSLSEAAIVGIGIYAAFTCHVLCANAGKGVDSSDSTTPSEDYLQRHLVYYPDNTSAPTYNPAPTPVEPIHPNYGNGPSY